MCVRIPTMYMEDETIFFSKAKTSEHAVSNNQVLPDLRKTPDNPVPKYVSTCKNVHLLSKVLNS